MAAIRESAGITADEAAVAGVPDSAWRDGEEGLGEGAVPAGGRRCGS